MARKPFDFDRKRALGLNKRVQDKFEDSLQDKEETFNNEALLFYLKNAIADYSGSEVTMSSIDEGDHVAYNLTWPADEFVDNTVFVQVYDDGITGRVQFYKKNKKSKYYQMVKRKFTSDDRHLKFNSVTVNGILDLVKKHSAQYVKESSLGLNKHVQKKFNDVDAVDNVSQIPFEDPEVERICHEHEVYTIEDARKVTSIMIDEDTSWFEESSIKSFNEFKYFTGLKEIEKYSFFKCYSLQSIYIPDSVTNIGRSVFSYCKPLQSINIPEGVTSIGDSAFYHCESLQSIYIPDSVTSIGDYAFGGCDSLQSINIPDGVTSIGGRAFYGCESLQSIYISKNCPRYNQIKRQNPDIQLIEPKVNESSSLGLNKHIQKKFQDVDAVDNISEYVDLGLPSGTLWCRHNYGADEEYEYGEYFKFDDAQELGAILPTGEDFVEMILCCNHEWTEVNGTKGMKFTSKLNGKSVFFPAAGNYLGPLRNYLDTVGNYWFSSTYQHSKRHYMHFNANNVSVHLEDKDFHSFSVRAVQKSLKETHLGLNKHVQKKFKAHGVEDYAEDIVHSVKYDTMYDVHQAFGELIDEHLGQEIYTDHVDLNYVDKIFQVGPEFALYCADYYYREKNEKGRNEIFATIWIGIKFGIGIVYSVDNYIKDVEEYAFDPEEPIEATDLNVLKSVIKLKECHEFMKAKAKLF